MTKASAAVSRDAGTSTAPTQFIETRLETYAYRRFGDGAAPPLIFLQYFTGTLDNWDPAVADAGAQGRELSRLAARTEDREPISGPAVAQAQIAAFRAWERVDGERFAKLRRIAPPCLVVNGIRDI